jgi:hypothetical protein
MVQLFKLSLVFKNFHATSPNYNAYIYYSILQ